MAGVAPQYGFHFQVWALAEALIRAQERDGAFMGAELEQNFPVTTAATVASTPRPGDSPPS